MADWDDRLDNIKRILCFTINMLLIFFSKPVGSGSVTTDGLRNVYLDEGMFPFINVRLLCSLVVSSVCFESMGCQLTDELPLTLSLHIHSPAPNRLTV